ncbi:MAG: hypothetical protein AAFQ90_13855, partial [Pseudomonadota bacterium]
MTWGRASQRDDAPTSGGFVAIACGFYHNVALHDDGTVVTWGDASEGQRRGAPTSGGFVAIACGSWHSVALRDGAIVA